MSVVVVATLKAEPGLGPTLVESFRQVSPLVHEEPGCELYAAHLAEDGDTLVMVERWTTREDLDAHSAGAALVRLNELNSGVLVGPADVWITEAVPLGDPGKGVIA